MFVVTSDESIPGDNPSDSFSPEGWSPEPGTALATIKLTPNPDVTITAVDEVTLDVQNVKEVIVKVTKPDGTKKQFPVVSQF